jgi:hypothetical protein
MAIVDLNTICTDRDWNDSIKFPGRFDTVRYENTDDPLEVIHRSKMWAPPAALGAGALLVPVTHYIAIKNMSKTEQVLLYFATFEQGVGIEVVIEPQLLVQFPDLDPVTQPPEVRTDAAITNNYAEIEVLHIGWIYYEQF